MKTFTAAVLAATFATAPAAAETLAWLPNEAGGRIVLSGDDCVIDGKKIAGGLQAVSFAPSMPMTNGCWAVLKHDTSQIMIIWEGESKIRTYPASDFTRAGGAK